MRGSSPPRWGGRAAAEGHGFNRAVNAPENSYLSPLPPGVGLGVRGAGRAEATVLRSAEPSQAPKKRYLRPPPLW